MKRWNFGGGRNTHGSKFHREPGSTGQSTWPHKTFKNVKFPGRMGGERVTMQNLKVVRIDAEGGLSSYAAPFPARAPATSSFATRSRSRSKAEDPKWKGSSFLEGEGAQVHRALRRRVRPSHKR